MLRDSAWIRANPQYESEDWADLISTRTDPNAFKFACFVTLQSASDNYANLSLKIPVQHADKWAIEDRLGIAHKKLSLPMRKWIVTGRIKSPTHANLLINIRIFNWLREYLYDWKIHTVLILKTETLMYLQFCIYNVTLYLWRFRVSTGIKAI